MRLRCSHRPHFSKRGLGFLFGIAVAATFLLAPTKEADSSVIKMPKPLPDFVKNHKSVKVWSGSAGVNRTGFKVNRGDYITILAKGTINVWPAKGKEYEYGPKALLVFLLGDNDHPLKQYRGPQLIEVKEAGDIYLGYRGSELNSYGRPFRTDYYTDD